MLAHRAHGGQSHVSFIITPHFLSPSFRAVAHPTRQHVDNFQRAGHIDEAQPYGPGLSLSAHDVQAREAVFEVTLLCLDPLNPEEMGFAEGIASRITYDTTASPRLHHHHSHKLVTNAAFSWQLPTSLTVA